MPQGPEDIASEQIDRMLVSAGWAVQDAKAVNLYAKRGVAIREFESTSRPTTTSSSRINSIDP